jgi:UDP-perosamine 4-acetyltransferase
MRKAGRAEKLSPIIVIGGGGHAKVLIDALKCLQVPMLGICEKSLPIQARDVLGVPINHTDEQMENYPRQAVLLVNGLGSIKDTGLRREVFQRFRKMGFSFRQVIHPAAVISPETSLGEGVQIMAGAVVQAGVAIGDNSLINTKASVDHDCTIGAHVHIAPGVTISGNVTIEEGVHVGAGATLIQGITIGKNCLIAAGTLVPRNVPPGVTVMGVPGRIRK